MRLRRLALLAGLLLACDPGASDDDWVATVDEQGISLGELRRTVERNLGEAPEVAREDAISEALNELITAQVMLNRASEIGVEVPASAVERRIKSLHGQDFADSDAAYRSQIRREMTAERAALLDLAEKVHVPESALVMYYQENGERFELPERIQLRQIVVDQRQTAQDVRARLEAGEDFESLAREVSVTPEASQGGRLPPFARGELPEVFDQAFDLKAGSISKVLESPFGFHILKLEARQPPQAREYEQVREEILLELERERLDELKRDWLRDLQRRAEIQVNEPLLESLK